MAFSYNPDQADTNARLFAQATIAITTTEIALTTGADANIVQFVRIYNDGAATIYIGPSGQTLEPLLKKQWIEFALNGSRVYGKTLSGTSRAIVTELG
jgi:hypothetical protein